MTFPTFTGTARELGESHRAAVHANLAGYIELFGESKGDSEQVRGWAEGALDETGRWAPALALRLAELAEGAGLEPWQVAAINARTEILAALPFSGQGECSTAVTGVNTAGLGVHFNILHHESDHDRIGVPVHLIARRILDEAAGVADAVEIARSARPSASTVITVVTASGAAALEICPAGVGVVEPDARGVLLHTNHFLDPPLALGEQQGTERPGSYARLGHLAGHVIDVADLADFTARARAMVSHGEAPVCAHADPAVPVAERWETVATIALDLDAARLHVHRGRLCEVTEAGWQTF